MANLKSIFNIKELKSPYNGTVESIVAGNKRFIFKVKYKKEQADGKKKDFEESVFIDLNIIKDKIFIRKNEVLELSGDKNNLEVVNYKSFSPSDSRENLSFVEIDNFSLKFHKFARFDKDKFSFYKTDKGKPIYNDVEGFAFNNIKFKLLAKQLEDSANSLFPKFNHVENLSIDWRLAIGLGTESVYETSINLHPVYGFPYIPGQAVKGIVRGWIIQEHFQNNEKLAFNNEVFCNLFGSPKESTNGESQGSLIFFDAYPAFAPQLKVDVMNPHYGPYYSEGKPPADYYNPIPIFFLTVENTKFQFIVAIKENDNEIGRIGNVGGTYFDLGKQFMKEALTQKGIGAKTAMGYGYFK